MRNIYIIQMDTKTIPSKIVSLFTMCKYGHVAISFNRNCDYIYSFGRRNLCSIINGGFIMESKTGKFFKKFKDTECRIYEIEVTDRQYNDLIKIIRYIKKNSDNYRYDYLGLILRYFKIPITFKNKYVCSYFVASLLEGANIYYFDKEIFNVTPKDFSKISGLNLIYTGKYVMHK